MQAIASAAHASGVRQFCFGRLTFAISLVGWLGDAPRVRVGRLIRMTGKKLRHREVGMPKSSLVESPALSSLPCLYPDDLDPAVQTELLALADIERHYEKRC